MRPEDLGVERAEIDRIAGGEPQQNAATVVRVLDGEDGPQRDVVLHLKFAGCMSNGRIGRTAQAYGDAACELGGWHGCGEDLR